MTVLKTVLLTARSWPCLLDSSLDQASVDELSSSWLFISLFENFFFNYLTPLVLVHPLKKTCVSSREQATKLVKSLSLLLLCF